MSIFLRWCRFNLVGAMGVAVQLTALAILSRWLAGHYMIATAAAVEITLIHNFVWHVHYTWRDRRNSPVLPRFARFHLANGMVSLIGNLALMPMLVESAHLPLLAANGVAILCCSIVNFCLGDLWAFAMKSNAVLEQP